MKEKGHIVFYKFLLVILFLGVGHANYGFPPTSQLPEIPASDIHLNHHKEANTIISVFEQMSPWENNYESFQLDELKRIYFYTIISSELNYNFLHANKKVLQYLDFADKIEISQDTFTLIFPFHTFL